MCLLNTSQFWPEGHLKAWFFKTGGWLKEVTTKTSFIVDTMAKIQIAMKMAMFFSWKNCQYFCRLQTRSAVA